MYPPNALEYIQNGILPTEYSSASAVNFGVYNPRRGPSPLNPRSYIIQILSLCTNLSLLVHV